MRRKIIYKLLAVSILWLLLAPTLAAQTATDVLDVRQKINHLQKQLEFLKELNSQFPDKRLEDLIFKIQSHIQKAAQALENRQRRLALQEATAASKLIDAAMRSVLTGPIVSLREQLEEKIRLAEELLRLSFSQKAHRLFQQAQKNKDQAEEALHQRNAAKAVELYRIALFNINLALDLLSAGDAGNLVQIFNEEKSNFEQLVGHIQNIVSQARISLAQSNEKRLCQELYNQALGYKKKAESSQSHGELKLAIDQLRRGAKFLKRALDHCGPAAGTVTNLSDVNHQQLAREELRSTQELLRSVERLLEPGKYSNLHRIYDQAQKVFSDATHSFQAGNYARAIQKAELARKFLGRAKDLSDMPERKITTRIEQEMELLNELLSTLSEHLTGQDNPGAARLLNLARQYLERGERSYQNKRLEIAAASLYAATKFALRAKAFLTQDLMQENLRQEALAAFARFEQKRPELLASFSGDPDPYSRAWLILVDEVYQAAANAEASGQYPVLLENSLVGIQLLERLEKRLAEKGS